MSETKAFRFDGNEDDWNDYIAHLKKTGNTVQQDLSSDIKQKLTIIRKENNTTTKTASKHTDDLSEFILENYDIPSIRPVTGSLHLILSDKSGYELINACGVDTDDSITSAAHTAIHRYWNNKIARKKVDSLSKSELETRLEGIAGTVKQNTDTLVKQEISKINLTGKTEKFYKNAIKKIKVTWECPLIPKIILSDLKESDIGAVVQFDCNIVGPSKKKLDMESGKYIQKILVQEIETDSHNSNPMVIKCLVHGDNTFNLASGQRKRIMGRYMVEPIEKGQKEESERSLVIDTFLVKTGEEEKTVTLSPRTLQRAHDAANDDESQYIQGIIDSFCPKIYGRELEKLALLLALLGGSKTNNFRNQAHLMLIGESDTGKSELVKYANSVASKSSIIDGANTTGVGILFALDEYDGTKILRSGVMIQNSGGHLIIDEFDKMPKNEQKKVNNAMEQQRATYNKGGHIGNAETKTAIIASCNPEGERWNDSKEIIDNLPFDASTISRYDLIIRLKHESTESEQRSKMKHIMNFKRGITQPIASTDYIKGLINHLKEKNPIFTPEAEALMVEKFVEFQFMEQPEGSLQVETRQMEGIQRLCEAYAKLTFKKSVDTDTVNFILDFYKKCLSTLGMRTDKGISQIDLRGHAINKDEFFDETFRVLSLLSDEGDVLGSKLAEKLLENSRMFKTDKSVIGYIESRKSSGYLFEPRAGILRRQRK